MAHGLGGRHSITKSDRLVLLPRPWVSNNCYWDLQLMPHRPDSKAVENRVSELRQTLSEKLYLNASIILIQRHTGEISGVMQAVQGQTVS